MEIIEQFANNLPSNDLMIELTMKKAISEHGVTILQTLMVSHNSIYGRNSHQ